MIADEPNGYTLCQKVKQANSLQFLSEGLLNFFAPVYIKLLERTLAFELLSEGLLNFFATVYIKLLERTLAFELQKLVTMEPTSDLGTNE